MRISAMFWIAISAGVLVTVLSSAVPATPGGGFVGATWGGFPVAWMVKMVVAPQYNPYTLGPYGALGFIADIVIWFVVALIILAIINFSSKGSGRRRR